MNGNYAAIGIVVSVWLWAAQNAPDGSLGGFAPEDVADAIGWKKAAGKLMDALVDTGFIDRAEDGSLSIHDWDEHAAMFQDAVHTQREKNRQRVQRYRERRRNAAVTDGNAPVTEDVTPDVTLQSPLQVTPVTPLPNQTVPNHTNTGGGDGGESAPARPATEEELALIGLNPGEYIGVTDHTVRRTQSAARLLFQKCGLAAPGPLDCRRVFRITALRQTDHGADIDTDRLALLRYAFAQAHAAGKPGHWGYVEGVLSRCEARGITTVQQALEYDESRAADAEGVAV